MLVWHSMYGANPYRNNNADRNNFPVSNRKEFRRDIAMLEKLYDEFPIMQELIDERVFSVQEDGNGDIEIIEQCDEWFSVTITKNDAKEISDFFRALSEIITL